MNREVGSNARRRWRYSFVSVDKRGWVPYLRLLPLKQTMRRLLCFAFCACSVVYAQTSSNPLNVSGARQARVQPRIQESIAPPVALGSVRAAHPIAKGVEVESENGRLQITAPQDDVIRVRATRASEFAPKYSYA